MDDLYVRIPKSKFNELAQEKKYEGISILSIALRAYSCRGTFDIDLYRLMDYFATATTQKQYRQTKIKKGIEDLGIELNGKSYATAPAPEIKDNYIMAHDHNIDKIFCSAIKTSIDRYKLVTLYLAIMSHMGTDSRESKLTEVRFTFVGHKKLAEETKLSANTINAYLKILIDMGVLMRNKVCDTYNLANGEIRSGRIYYSYISKDEVLNRYAKHKIKEYANEYKQELLDKGYKLYVDGEIISKDTIELNPILNVMTKETEYTEQVF